MYTTETAVQSWLGTNDDKAILAVHLVEYAEADDDNHRTNVKSRVWLRGREEYLLTPFTVAEIYDSIAKLRAKP